MVRRRNQQNNFDKQVVLAHIQNHEGTVTEDEELAVELLYHHFRWSPRKTRQILNQLQTRNLVFIEADKVHLTARGKNRVQAFRAMQLARETEIQ